MTDLTTAMALSELGEQLDRDGSSAHGTELSNLAGIARQRGLPEDLIALLEDPQASEVVRQRAFSSLARLLSPAAHQS